MRKIIVATTFRDFNGNANDKIQRMFLKSIRNQTHQDYVLVVSVFKEKNVEEALKEAGVKYIVKKEEIGTAKFSMTRVTENALDIAAEYPESIFVWATCDTIMNPRFFEYLANLKETSLCGTSYPHIGYRTLEDLVDNRAPKHIWLGLDLFFFNSSVLLAPKVREAIRNYPNIDWGYFEFQMAAWGFIFAEKTINIWPIPVTRVDNDYAAAGQRYELTKATSNKNRVVLEQFTAAHNLDNDYYHWIPRFKMIDRSFRGKLMQLNINYHIWYATSFIRRGLVPRIKKVLGKKRA
jgi:hypothetical protein